MCSTQGCLGNFKEGVWEVFSCFTQVNLRVILGKELMKGKGENLILGSLEDHLDVLREGVREVSLRVTQVSRRITTGENDVS